MLVEVGARDDEIASMHEERVLCAKVTFLMDVATLARRAGALARSSVCDRRPHVARPGLRWSHAMCLPRVQLDRLEAEALERLLEKVR